MLEVQINKVSRKVQPGMKPVPEQLPKGSRAPTPINAGQHNKLPPTRLPSSSSADESEAASPVDKIRSLRVTLYFGENLVSSKSGRMPEKPYVEATMGKLTLRTTKVHSVGDHVDVNQVLVFPCTIKDQLTLK